MNVSMACALYDVEMKRLGKQVQRRENIYEVEDAFAMLEKIGDENGK